MTLKVKEHWTKKNFILWYWEAEKKSPMHLFAIKKVDRIISKLSSSHNSLRFDRENSSKNSLNIFCTLKKTSKSCSKNWNFILDFYIHSFKIINSKVFSSMFNNKNLKQKQNLKQSLKKIGYKICYRIWKKICYIIWNLSRGVLPDNLRRGPYAVVDERCDF